MYFSQRTPWLRNALFVLFASLLIHLIFGFLLGLSVDEAHYALYGLHLDWSYFDHPPMVGWIQSIPVQLNAPDGVIRFIPEILWLIAIVLNLKIADELLQHKDSWSLESNQRSVMWWTSIVIVLAPILHVLAVGLLPDTLLLVLVPCMMLLTIKLSVALEASRPKDIKLWILLGVVLGLSGLSKYTSLFFALAIPFCLIRWHGLKVFTRPGLWLALVIAIELILPVIYWNVEHHWISFIYQFGHGTGGSWKIKRVLTFLLNQLACYGVLIPLGMIWLLRRRYQLPFALLSFFFIPFLLFAYFSGGGGSLPHWTSPAWMALSPFAGIGLAQAWQEGRRFWIWSISSLQLFLCLLGFTLLFFGGIPSISKDHAWGQKNPIADLYGWKEAGEHIKELSAKYQVDHVAVQNWTMGSRVGWYARPLPIFILDDRIDQFDLWAGLLPVGSDAIVLDWSQMSFAYPVSEGEFESCELIDSQTVHRLGRDIASFDFLLCKNWQGSLSTQRNP